MLYQIAYLYETTENGRVWMWITRPMEDVLEAEFAYDYYINKFHSDTVAYGSGKTEAELQEWLKRKNKDFYEHNTPTKRASLPEESGPGRDKDAPYVFSLPTSWREQEAWLRLARKYRSGELES